MAGIKVGFPFTRTSSAPIDESLVLTKEQMKAVNDSHMPEKYFTICADDGKLYIYDKLATADPVTGKFSMYAGYGGPDGIPVTDLEALRLNSLPSQGYDDPVPIAEFESKFCPFADLEKAAKERYMLSIVRDFVNRVSLYPIQATYESRPNDTYTQCILSVKVFTPEYDVVFSTGRYVNGEKPETVFVDFTEHAYRAITAGDIDKWNGYEAKIEKGQVRYEGIPLAEIENPKEGDIALVPDWQEIQVEIPTVNGQRTILPLANRYRIVMSSTPDDVPGLNIAFPEESPLGIISGSRGPIFPDDRVYYLPKLQEGYVRKDPYIVCIDDTVTIDELRVFIESAREYEYINGTWQPRNHFSGSYDDLSGKPDIEGMIDQKLADFDHLDDKVADSAPTATKVVIKGVEVDVVEGVRYLVEIPGENKFEEYVVLDGTVYDLGNAAGGGTTELETDLVVTNPIGKYAKDDEIPKGTTLESIIWGMLSKTYYPTLTPPSVSVNFSLPALAKVGQEIASGEATVSFDRGSINPQYSAESPYRAGNAEMFFLSLMGASVEFEGENDNGTFTIPAFTKNNTGVINLHAVVEYEKGPQPKDSDGNNYQSPLGPYAVDTYKTCEFILPFYWGKSASAAIADLSGLTEDLRKKENRSYSYDTHNEHMVFAYDAKYGELKSILDQNNFETISGWIVNTITVDGQQYKVYVAELATTDTGATYTFKF